MYDMGPLGTSEEIKQALNLVYSSLSAELKTCLLYLNMYPEDYVIRKDDLVKQWVAESFVVADGQDIEKVAGDYFVKLVNAGMIQPVDTSYNGEVLSCTVHHMVQDLIACKSMEDNFITVLDYIEIVMGLPDMVRRLSLKFGGARGAQVPESIRMSQVRSLLFSGFFKCIRSIVEYKLLRVLILYVWADRNKKSFDLTTICQLFLLRYLKVECNISVKLPEQIQGLRFMETMEVDARVNAVPSDIILLQRLLHLRLPGGTSLPHQFGQLISLRTLGYFDLSRNSEVNVLDLGKLTNLQHLRLTCSWVSSEKLFGNMEVLGSILGNLSNLKSITLVPGSAHGSTIQARASSVTIPCDDLNCDSSIPSDLERLELFPRICIFSTLPRWIRMANKLGILKIAVRELRQSDIDTLKTFNALSALSLSVRTAPAESIVFHIKEGFPVLKHFKFICYALCLVFREGAMPNVRRLKLGLNANTIEKYSPARAGFQNLKSLAFVCVKIGCAGAAEFDKKDVISTLKGAIGICGSSPIINVQWVDWIFCNQMSAVLQTKQPETPTKVDVVITGASDNEKSESEGEGSEDWRSGTQETEEWSMKLMAPVLAWRVRLIPAAMFRPMELQDRIQCILLDIITEMQYLVLAVKDAGSRNTLSSHHVEWTQQLEELFCDIEDFINNRRHYFFHLGSQINSASHLMSRLRFLKCRVPDIFRSRSLPQGRGKHIDNYTRTDTASWPSVGFCTNYASTDKLVGIQEAKSELLELVLSEDSQQEWGTRPHIRVISIVGCPGVGKTSIASEVFVDPQVCKSFQRAWVVASQFYNADELIKNVIQQVIGPSSADYLTRAPEGILEKKRCLVVIDNMQKAGLRMLSGLRNALQKCEMGSRIIVTTSSQSVALTISSSSYIFRMRVLDEDDSKELLSRNVSKLARKSTLELDLQETLKKCDGLPLALISSAANFLCVQGQQLTNQLPLLPLGANQEMNKALMQCFDSLPDDETRLCLLSLSIFPKDHLIKRKSLIRRWIAEGLVSQELSHDVDSPEEVVGDASFNELIDQFIIEPVLIGNNSKVKRGRVQGALLEVIANVSVSNKLVILIQGDRAAVPGVKIVHTAHALCIHGYVKIGKVNAHIRWDRIRSLTIFGGVAFDFERCSLLRVLDLEGCNGVNEWILAGICRLLLLKYVSLRGSDVYRIPRKIRQLKFLETLDIRETAVKELPMEALMLPQLLHLFGWFELPQELRDRTKRSKLERFFREESRLQTLSGFVFVGNSAYEHIVLHMRLLRKLKIWCQPHYYISKDSELLFVSSLQKRLTGNNALESLSIIFPHSHMDEGEYFADCFINNTKSSDPCMLSSIKLQGKLPGRLPHSITSPGNNLSELQLSNTGLPLEELSTLQRLRRLLYLKLAEYGDGFPGDTFVVGSNGFTRLQRLCFEAPKLPRLRIVEGAMPALTSLHLLCPESEYEHPRYYKRKIDEQETTSEIQHSNKEWEIKYSETWEIESLKNLKDVVLPFPFSDQALHIWKEKARKHINWPQVTKQPIPAHRLA